MKKQSCKISFIIPILTGLMVLTLLAGCMAPPTQQIADAQAALEKAKAAGAQKYAGEKYKAAQDLLNQAMVDNERAAYFEAERSAKGAVTAAQAAEKAGVKAKSGALKTANFETAALGSHITTAKAMINNARKAGASAKDLSDAVYNLDFAMRLYDQAQDMLKSGSLASATNAAVKGQPRAEAASSTAFAALAKAKAGDSKAAAKKKAGLKRDATFEVSAAAGAITTAGHLVSKAMGTARAGTVELNAARSQLSQAKALHSKASAALSAEDFAGAVEKGNMSREMAENATSSAFKAIAMSKRQTK